MSTEVADLFIRALAPAGVKRISGVVGGSLNGLTEALRQDGAIAWIHTRHEESAAFAAGAEAHLTGEPAVCIGSCGPGNLHLINGLFGAHAPACPCWPSRRRSRRRRSAGATSRGRSRRTCSRNAATPARWSPRRPSCLA